MVTTNAAGYGWAMALQTDGKMVVAGSSDNGSNFDLALARYNIDGSLDTTFSGDGLVITDSGLREDGHDVALQSDGKILVVGYHHDGANEVIAVWRYNTDGSLDTTFSGDGKVVTAAALEWQS